MVRPFAIFDMDGTLVDSMPYWSRLTEEYLETLQLPEADAMELREIVARMSLRESAELFQDALNLEKTPEEIELEMGDLMDHHYQNDIPLRDGVQDYLEKLRAEDVAMCVATLTPAPLAKQCLERLGIAEYFSFILSSDDVGAGKDRPDIFLQAAWEFGVYPPDIAVYEDSHYAARAAREAGCFVVGIYEETHAEQWPRMERICDVVIGSWQEAVEYL